MYNGERGTDAKNTFKTAKWRSEPVVIPAINSFGVPQKNSKNNPGGKGFLGGGRRAGRPEVAASIYDHCYCI
jgi:hypothetical protein